MVSAGEAERAVNRRSKCGRDTLGRGLQRFGGRLDPAGNAAAAAGGIPSDDSKGAATDETGANGDARPVQRKTVYTEHVNLEKRPRFFGTWPRTKKKAFRMLGQEQATDCSHIFVEDTLAPSVCADVLECYVKQWPGALMPHEENRRLAQRKKPHFVSRRARE